MNILFFIAVFATASSPERLPGYLNNPGYIPFGYEKQSKPVISKITKIVSPSLGHPVIAESGQNFIVWTTAKPALFTLLPKDGCGLPFKINSFSVQKQGKFYKSIVQMPLLARRNTFDLQVTWESGTFTAEPASVRCTGAKNKKIKILLLADHQLSDPSWKLTKGLRAPSDFPKHGKDKNNESITLQEFEELKLLDPDFAVHLGDLLFGLEYDEEYNSAYNLWKHSPVSVFFIPGNHDAYATYTIAMPPLSKLSLGLIRCRKLIPLSWGETSWWKVWNFISCLYSDVKNTLFDNLVADGLVYWKHTFGPVNYTYTKGKFHFIFLNTYGGTNKRRHSFSIYLKAWGYKLGAPAVDNYGGYLSDKDLKWIKEELEYAKNHKLTPVFFAHQDPRGNLKGRRYHTNDPFPTDPIGIDHFEEWNYDDKWDSDPSDSRTKETATDNSAVKLLKLLAKSGGYYISGHIHKDGMWKYLPGQNIIPGVKTAKPLTFIKVTSAASSVKDNGYWGYRIIEALPDGTLNTAPFTKQYQSVPSGNFWISDDNQVPDTFTLASSLPAPLNLTVSVCLEKNENGYFLMNPEGNKIPPVSVSYPSKASFVKYSFKLKTPVSSGNSYIKENFKIKKLSANAAPLINVKANGKLLSDTVGTLECPKKMNASSSKDPDGDKLYDPIWILDSHKVVRGYEIKLSNVSKPTELIFKVRDSAGKWSEKRWILTKRKKSDRTFAGCGCRCVMIRTGAGSSVFVLIFFVFLAYFRRKKHI